jgi:dGTP triphosphohydrolase
MATKKTKTSKSNTETKPKKKKHPGGRPSKYKPEYAEQVYKLAQEGFTDKKIAGFFKVREKTINNWKKIHSEFLQSLKRGKDEFDSDVIEASLVKRASGYSHPDVHISNYQGKITITDITKHYPPDPTSMIFWLKNRRQDRWRDKRSIEVGVSLADILAALPKEYADEVRAELEQLVLGKGRRAYARRKI